MNSPAISLHHHHSYAEYGYDDSRFYQQQSTPPEDAFDDENQLPSPDEFRAIIDDYLNNLSPKKRDKALVDQHRYYLIQQVLRDPRNTAISTAQFRFWVKKMFQLQPGSMDLVCHDNKPVAMKEQIYDILVKAHREAHHGGRDKTSALVRRQFSWIPKELVARFVRHCPFCITRRNGGQSPSTFASKASSPRQYIPRHGFSFDPAPPILCTPSTIQEDSDISSSGPPSAENGYDSSPNYVAMSNASPPRRSYYGGPIYGREEEEFLRNYPYESSLQPSYQPPMMSSFLNNRQQHTDPSPPHPQDQQPASTPHQQHSSLFYQHQGYVGYPAYHNTCYPNVLGIAPCTDSTPSADPFLRSTNGSGSGGAGSDLLNHQEHPSFLQSSANHFVPYPSAQMPENAFGAPDI